jgi:hypothetical protein
MYKGNDALAKTFLGTSPEDIASIPLASINSLFFFRFYELKTGNPISNSPEIYGHLMIKP